MQASVQAFLPPKRKTTSGGWTSFNAVCCHHKGDRPDTKKRGGVMFTEAGFTYHCFNCGFKAGWTPGKLLSKNTKDLFRWLGMPEFEVSKLSLEALREKDSIPTATRSLTFELHDKALPEDCLPISEWIKAGCDDEQFLAVVDYVLSRGLTLADYNWHWSATNGYRDRVIIPFYYDSRIVGYTGRKITAGNPKYLTEAQSGYVFNTDAQTYDREYVIVVEGQFDAIAIDGVGIMTNTPNETQCARISQLGKSVIVVPDRDNPGAKLIEAALKNNWNISVPPWGEDIKDVADAVKAYGKVYTLATILHYQESNKIKIELIKKKLERVNGN